MPANLRLLLDSPAARVAVAVRDGAVVGFAVSTTSFGLEHGLIAELEDLFVEFAFRGRGIGDALIDDAAAWARTRGAHHLEVVTSPNGADISRLRAYYAERGFVDDGRRLSALPLTDGDRGRTVAVS